eukprot:m.747772 g.747772  ORF g.747772 m.747772 type:complete len:794 (+) comp23145_c1_seq2:308-2689(+)
MASPVRFVVPPPPDDGVRFHRTLSVEPTFAPPPPPADPEDDAGEDIGIPAVPPPHPPGNTSDVSPLVPDVESCNTQAPPRVVSNARDTADEFTGDYDSANESNEDLVFTRGSTAPANAATGAPDQTYDIDSSDDGGDDDRFSDAGDDDASASDSALDPGEKNTSGVVPTAGDAPAAPAAANSYIDVDGVDGAVPTVDLPVVATETSPLGAGDPLSPVLLRKASLAKLPHVEAPVGTTAYAFTFHRTPGEKLGLQLAGGAFQRGTSFGVDVRASSDIVGSGVAVPQKWVGLFVKRLSPGGAAAAAGQFEVGDQLLSVNGVSFLKLSHQAAVEVLASASSDLEVVIARRDVRPQSIAPQASGFISPTPGAIAKSPDVTGSGTSSRTVTSPLQHCESQPTPRTMSTASRTGTFTRPTKRPPPPPTGAVRGTEGGARDTPLHSTATPPRAAPVPRPRTATTVSTAAPAGNATTTALAPDEAKRRAAEAGVAALLTGPLSPERPTPRPRASTTVHTSPESDGGARDTATDDAANAASMDISICSSQGLAEALMSANAENPARMNTATKNRLIALLGDADDEAVEAVANDEDTSGDDDAASGANGSRRTSYTRKGKSGETFPPTSPLKDGSFFPPEGTGSGTSQPSPTKSRSLSTSAHGPAARAAQERGLTCKNRCGWMLKQGGGTKTIMSRKNWKRRFFVLKESMLFYYKPDAVLPDESGVKPGVTATGYINLSAESKVGQPTERRILLEQPNRDFAFICPSRTSAKEWHDAIAINLRVIIQQTISAFQSKNSKATHA